MNTLHATDSDAIIGNIVPIKDRIFAYTLYRSVSNQRLFNVVAVNRKGEMLLVAEADMQFDDAAERIEELNKALGQS